MINLYALQLSFESESKIREKRTRMLFPKFEKRITLEQTQSDTISCNAVGMYCYLFRNVLYADLTTACCVH